MGLDFAAFALRQMLNSMVVVGPLLMITGLSLYVFREGGSGGGRSMRTYLLLGLLCTVAGACSLVQELRIEQGVASPSPIERLKATPAQK